MSDIEEHPSVMAYHGLGKTMASREIALAMAEMLIKKVHGEEHLKTQLPLQAFDDGDRWRIEGSRDGEVHPMTLNQLHEGKVVIEVRKANCQVLKIVQIVW